MAHEMATITSKTSENTERNAKHLRCVFCSLGLASPATTFGILFSLVLLDWY